MSYIGIVNTISIIVLIFTILLALIYLISIIFLRRFHTVNNIITANLCFAAICCAMFWTFLIIMEIFYASNSYNGKVCIVATYFEMMCNLQVSLAIIGASVNRLCSIVYHTKPFLRTRKWTIVCVIGQWAVGIILSLPDLPFNDSSCDDQLWKAIYKLIIIVIVPSIICLM
ncbi:unnamed protein product, partial [Adineta steineri]